MGGTKHVGQEEAISTGTVSGNRFINVIGTEVRGGVVANLGDDIETVVEESRGLAVDGFLDASSQGIVGEGSAQCGAVGLESVHADQLVLHVPSIGSYSTNVGSGGKIAIVVIGEGLGSLGMGEGEGRLVSIKGSYTVLSPFFLVCLRDCVLLNCLKSLTTLLIIFRAELLLEIPN